MFHDAREMEDGSEVRADLCIVGAGPAGIAIAREFIDSPLRLALLVGGGIGADRRSQKLYSGDNIGTDNYSPYSSRARGFGGSSARWGGMSRPFERLDFEKRPCVSHSGWPLSAEDLSPFYERAHEVCHLGPYDYSSSRWASLERASLPLDRSKVDLRIYQFAHPLDFGKIYGDELASARNIDIYFHAHATQLEVDADARRMTGVRANASDGRALRFVADRFVLACGGLENPRLLLASNEVVSAGLGNTNDLVGRFFIDHPYFYNGWFEASSSAPNHALHVIEDYDRMGSDRLAVAAFALPEDTLEREQLNGAVLYFILRPRYTTLADYVGRGRRSLNKLRDGLVGYDELTHAGRRIREVVGGLGGVGRSLAHQAAHLARPQTRLALRSTLEATPNPRSRVTLGRKRDSFGMPRIELDWRINPGDRRGLDRLLEAVQLELAGIGAGRLVLDHAEDDAGWPLSMSGGLHHMGTTRMHQDPKHGVVDADCRVHDLPNLYVAGSSVFPTGGVANPTLTIVALALRLADHLKTRSADRAS